MRDRVGERDVGSQGIFSQMGDAIIALAINFKKWEWNSFTA